MRPLSKSQERRFKAQKDPKHLARQTQRHESAVKYKRPRHKAENYEQEVVDEEQDEN